MSNTERITQAFGDAGTEVTVGALNVIKASGQGMTIVADKSTGIVTNLGDVAVTTTETFANVTGTVAGLTNQMKTKTQEAAKALAITEQDITRQKIAQSKGTADVSIAQSEADTKKNYYEFKMIMK